MPNVDYDDTYSTCSETFVSLRVLPGELGVPSVSSALGLEPTQAQVHRPRAESQSGRATAAVPAGWFLSSKGLVESKDVRRHLDWLLDQLIPKAEALQRLRSRGAIIDVSCYWVSAHGHGGPALSAAQSAKLATLELDLWFDVYCDAE
jgi:hypothetical protein